MNSHAAIMFLAGLGIPVLAALNAALGARIASPTVAAFFLFLVAILAVAPIAAAMGSKPFIEASSAPKHLFLAGAFVVFYVLSVTHIAPVIGVGNAVFLVLMGQIVGASVIDHFGLFGATTSPMSLRRFLGVVFMGVGVWAAR